MRADWWFENISTGAAIVLSALSLGGLVVAFPKLKPFLRANMPLVVLAIVMVVGTIILRLFL